MQFSGAPRWVLRALILARVRWQGISTLTGADQVAPLGFSQAVPDQSDWVPRMLKLADRQGSPCRSSLAAFLRFCSLGRQPPEYCTMYLCIWGTSQLPEDVVQWLQQNRVALRDACHQYHKQHGMWPHPLTLYEAWAARAPGPTSSKGPVVQATGSSGPVVSSRAVLKRPSVKHVVKEPSCPSRVSPKGR